jgi:CxxC motif-containing protein (DUF1111 family)
LGALAVLIGAGACAAAAEAPTKEQLAQGRELFAREWLVGDARSHGGDGLGPVYNDSSCVACHNAGAPGGAGPTSKNVDILSAFPQVVMPQQMVVGQPQPGFLRRAVESLLGIDPPAPPRPATPPKPAKLDTSELIKTHAGFRTARSVVLHRFGVDPNYESWRLGVAGLGQVGGMFNPVMSVAVGGAAMGGQDRAMAELNQVKMVLQFRNQGAQFQSMAGPFSLVRSQRNPTALFGAGLIDSVPDAVLEAAAKAKHQGFPEVQGRVSRQKDGRLGRFGWKAQTPTLNDFVLTACAVELGLEVPDHHQGGLPQKPEERAKGLDLSQKECDALIAYVRALPRPAERSPSGDVEAREVASGRTLFAGAGCAACHTPDLGKVRGLYSDLLLHDMGPELGDTGQYGVFTPESSEPEFVDPAQPIAEAAPDQAAPVAVPVEAVLAPPPVPPAPIVVPPPTVEAPAPAGSITVTTTTDLVAFAPGQPAAVKRPTTGPASRQEWRTPPLWGFRDSGPYLHDGRADTLDQAVALHGGEATRSAQKYFQLSPRERLQVQAFLKSLVAPTEELARASE